jgi:hypothetical protein
MFHVPYIDPCILPSCEPQTGVGNLAAQEPILAALLLIGLSLVMICTIVLILKPLFIYLLSEEVSGEKAR